MGFLKGLNHITFAVRELERSVDFYCQVLGFELHVIWDTGAYITCDSCWICLSVDPNASPSDDYSHIAFSLHSADLQEFSCQLSEQGVKIWQENTSEGGSVYFLDPDGHKLEAHVGDLHTRIESIRAEPYEGQNILSD